MRVNFLIGGTEPAGLNHLYELLRAHPDVCLPEKPQPEPNFFSKHLEYEKGINYYWQKHFSHYAGEQMVGEKSGRYLWHPEAAGRIFQYNPKIKLIFILRDPVQRAFSNYRFNCMSGLENLSFRTALRREDDRVAKMNLHRTWRDIHPFAYFDKGLYCRQLRRYLDLFQRDRILMIENVALRDNAGNSIREILEFLGLSTDRYVQPAEPAQYPSYHVRSRFVQSIFRIASKSLLEAAIVGKRSGQQSAFLHRLIHLNLSDQRPTLGSDLDQQLRDAYDGEMKELSPFVPFNIAHWFGQSNRHSHNLSPPPSPPA